MKQLLLTALCSLTLSWAFSQKHTLSGYIKDAANGEDLIGATVYVDELKSGTSANVYGFYSITLPEGTYTITWSYIGYAPYTERVELKGNITRDMELSFKTENLKEVVIAAEREDENLTEVEMSVEKMELKTIEKVPQFMGETDVIRTFTLLPGVTTVGEGAPGLNVRGGNIDQNLLLLDEGPVYNSSHLFGFFSIFNPDAVKDVQLYKGGIPARYGGRLSSVMDVRQRDGNAKTLSAQGGIGTVSSRLTVEGPILKDKMSFLVSARRSYADLFLLLTEDFSDTKAYFYDLNMKVNYDVNEKNRVYLSGYFGRDVFGFGEAFSTDWGNKTATLRWNHLFSEKLFSNFTAIYADYGYALGSNFGNQGFEWNSSVVNYNLKADFTYYLNPNHTLEFGGNAIQYIFSPGNVQGTGEGAIFDQIKVPTERNLETAVYVSNEHKVSDKLSMEYGIRYSQFVNYGGQLNQYQFGIPTEASDITGVEYLDQYEVSASYNGFEPRFGVNYRLSETSSVKASYNRMRQYIHLVSNTTAATPIDVWKPAGKYVDPATADQVAVGYYRNFKNNMYKLSVEGYYKMMYDVLDYKDGAELLLNQNVETEFLSGDGRAYGLEFMLKKSKGRLTGWIAYTLARTERQVGAVRAGDYVNTGINNGDWFSANYDKPHDLSIVASYDLNDRWEASANFSYATGRPITYPEGKFVYDGINVPFYGNRNENRIPDYHRLDVSFTYTPIKNNSRRWQGKWIFGVYNLYGRRNPYSIFFRTAQNESVTDFSDPFNTEAVQLSIIGIPVPSVTYNFTF